MRIEYQEHDLDGVMRYYGNGFRAKDPKEEILKYEFTIDVFARKVIFKIYADKKEKANSQK